MAAMHQALSTKLFIPPLRRNYVERARLLASLDEALNSPLAVLSAPPGSGKTTLLSAWLRQVVTRPFVQAGWVTLDSEDNDPLRFWSYVGAAFPTLEGASSLVSALLTTPESLLPFVRAWINLLAAAPGQFVLALDDYHLIEAPAVQTSLLYLLEHIPANLHVVISTRSDPPLPLGRWRVRGQLVEIRLASLRFVQAEAAAFLTQQTGVTLSAEQLLELEKRTEGWAAGLQVLAMGLKDQPAGELDRRIAAFSGRHHYVLDYLSDEVFNRQPQNVQDFLLVTSVLKRLSAGLCSALLAEAGLAHTNAQAMLSGLERDNLFLLALDEERNWYRYHPLFAELLQARLREAYSTAQVTSLNRRAAEWHQAEGWASEAIAYALAAGDEALAAGLLEDAVRRADTWSQGEIRTVLGWMKALAPQAIAARPWLRLYQSRALFVAGRQAEAEAILDELEGQGLPEDPQLAAHLAGSRARLAAARGQVGQAIAAAERALAGLAPTASMARSAAASSMGYALLLKGDLPASLQWTKRAYEESLANGFRLLAINTLANLAWASLLQGRVSQAEAWIEAGVRLGTIGGQLIPASGLILILRAERLYERGELQQAGQAARQGLELLAQGGIEDTTQTGHILLARLQQAGGDAAGAAETIQQAVAQAQRAGLERPARSAVAYQARLWLQQGQHGAARAWAAAYRALPPVEYLHEGEDLVLARVLLENGEAQAALDVSRAVRAAAEQGGRDRRLLEALLVQARAWQALNRPDSAHAALLQALALAEAQGIRQLFLDEGQDLRPLLAEAARRG